MIGGKLGSTPFSSTCLRGEGLHGAIHETIHRIVERNEPVPKADLESDPAWPRAHFCQALLLKNDWRPADSLRLQGDGHLYAVGDLDEGDAAVHPVVLTVEVQFPVNLA